MSVFPPPNQSVRQVGQLSPSGVCSCYGEVAASGGIHLRTSWHPGGASRLLLPLEHEHRHVRHFPADVIKKQGCLLYPLPAPTHAR